MGTGAAAAVDGPTGTGAEGAAGFPAAGASGLDGAGGGFGGWEEDRRYREVQRRHQKRRDDRALLHQPRGSIKIDAPRSGVTRLRAADHSRPGEMGGSVLSGATRASFRAASRVPPALPEHTPNSSARIGTPP